MARDIDYAATAVKKAVVEKYGRANDLDELDSSQTSGRSLSAMKDDRQKGRDTNCWRPFAMWMITLACGRYCWETPNPR